MAHRIEFTRAAERDLRALAKGDRALAQRVSGAIAGLAANPRPSGVVKLSGASSTYRVRVGNYRILYEVEDTVLLVTVIRVAHRKEAYQE